MPRHNRTSNKGYLNASAKNKLRRTFHPQRIVEQAPERPPVYSIYHYNAKELKAQVGKQSVDDCHPPESSEWVTWINMEGLRKADVERLCQNFSIHPLLAEDILSIGQRAKMDDMEVHLFSLMPMLSYNEDTGMVQLEQLSLVLGSGFVISFQSGSRVDTMAPVRERLKNNLSSIRQKGADYLAYSIMDAVVDDYFSVLERLSDRLERLEDEVVMKPNGSILVKVTLLRHELMVVKRAIAPVRELINAYWHTDSYLVADNNKKYFKDVYDHIVLAIEYAENYREMAGSLQDLYMNRINTRMNEVMKILTVVTTLLAPATVIGGIFGMNFDKIPFTHQPHGFIITVGSMLLVGFVMLLYFKKKGWY